jgi:Tol biopolymer transport system component
MHRTYLFRTSAYLSLAIAGCASSRSQTSQISADGQAVSQDRQRRQFSDWSPPVNIGPEINTEFNEQFPTISADGLSLYFSSDRPGGFGGADIYVSHRPTVTSPWGKPQNLGPRINSSSDDHSQNFSPDGHWMWFASGRPGGCGDKAEGNRHAKLDIWVSYRKDVGDDNAWEAPVNLGCSFNSPAGDSCPFYFEDPASGIKFLYLVSGRPGGPGKWNVYASSQQNDGHFGTPVLVSDVSSTQYDFHFAPRLDGLEAFIWSVRAGGLGDGDLWVSTRTSTQEAWSTPVNLGPTINTEFDEQMPSLSADDTELFFTSNRPGGKGGYDLYISKRKPLAQHAGR